MKREPEETYRSFYNRLVGFMRQHLPQQAVNVEGISSPPNGEHLTVALLDAIAIHWLLSIDKRLVSIIKTEFASDLKTKRLSQMIKQIAQNIDELLARHGHKEQISQVSSNSRNSQLTNISDGNSEMTALIQRIENLENSGRKNYRRNKWSKQPQKEKCTHCLFLNKQLGSNLRVDHASNTCGKNKVSISLVESMGSDYSQSSYTGSQSECEEGDQLKEFNPLISTLQTDNLSNSTPSVDGRDELKSSSCTSCNNVVVHAYSSTVSDPSTFKSNFIDKEIQSDNCSPVTEASNSVHTCLLTDPKELPAGKAANIASLNSNILATLREPSTYAWNTSEKFQSPRGKCQYITTEFTALVDSGAEINALDLNFARSLNIPFSQTQELARAANKLPLEVCGQTIEPLSIKCFTDAGYVMLELGIVLVIANLGASCLLGEPAKSRNNIVCLPRLKLIVIAKGDVVHSVPYYQGSCKYSLLRAIKTQILAPGDSLQLPIPEHLSTETCLSLTPRSNSTEWLQTSMVNPTDGVISLVNSSSYPVSIKKSDHLADLRDTTNATFSVKPISGKAIHDDKFQFRDFALARKVEPDYLSLIKVDPDNILSNDQKDIFHKLFKRFAALFTPQPGKYNGAWGYIDNCLQFSTPPPPNTKTRIPNYSPPMNSILAEKMDALEAWGVLAEPETMGISVEFICPSMLVPKPERNEYRLVTDFSALNVFLKKVPNTTPTIAQAKARIASAQYVIHLDFSNFFYQNGLQKTDCKYLGTIHPFKGLRVYTCDPQGLKGASERSYEKLARIFGDLVQARRLAQMADGLHVLGNSIQELAENYVEVLNRAERCGLTFKPSKVIVCPRRIILFGWELRDHVWYPTEHTTSALVNAPKPSTIKQMRSFLGSFKQLSATLPRYAETIHSLEQLVGGRASAEKIVWTDDLQKSFSEAKQLAANPMGIAEPRPEDQLFTYSDYSADNRAVGGRLVIQRKQPDGSIATLIGGFFSTILDKHKQSWLPCEGEACGIRLVLEHFQNQIRESEHPTIHYTDSQACVLAWKRSKRGAFSSSSRIAAFLTGLSTLPVELRHKPGKEMCTSDYASRHPPLCKDSLCQICRFVNELENIGDNAVNIRALSIEDIRSGKTVMPMIQRKIWKNLQAKDSIHCKLLDLIRTRQLPETKKRKGEHTKLKLLHNLYVQGKLYVKDGLVLVKTPESEPYEDAISVPPSIFPGIVSALHIRLDHPSKTQLTGLIGRYFYSPGWRTVINDVTEFCHQCATLKTLPKVLIQDTTTPPANIGSNFAADVLEREGQKILVIREELSQFTRAAIIPDQKAATLRKILMSLVLDILPDSGAEIRVDGATAFQSLQVESLTDDSLLKSLGIKFVVGRLMNRNKNPVAENTVKEIQKEILRLKSSTGPVSETELALVIRNINSRVRYNSHTPKEILFRRDTYTNSPINLDDTQILSKLSANRHNSAMSSLKHEAKSKKATPQQQFSRGDLVMMRENKFKNSPRDTYIVKDLPSGLSDKYILIRKITKSLRPRLYQVLPDEIIHSPFSPTIVESNL